MTEMNAIESTKKRLQEIESELTDLKKERKQLNARWEAEKLLISRIRSCKSEIEDARKRAEDMERAGDLGKVAEIRYGKIPELEQKLSKTNTELQELQKQGKMLTEEIDAEDIADVVAKWTGIPVNKMLETEKTKLLKMEERIHKRLIGQDEAVVSVSNAIRRSRAGLQDQDRPMGSFIFLGSTGVGKTEMAKALAEFLFDDENAVVRIDMSEYMEKFAVSRLIGAPPGYVGYDEGGQLTEAVRRRPYAVILLDEIEKAHTEVFNVLLQVLDDGRLTDSKGRTVNFKNTLIIMTSNLGSEFIREKISEINDSNRIGILHNIRQKVFEQLKQRMRPEFLNRVDDIIIFNPLTEKEIEKIASLQFNKLKEKAAEKGIELSISGPALKKIGEVGFDPVFGARPLKRAVQNHFTNPLAVKILSSEIISGDNVNIDIDKSGNFIFLKNYYPFILKEKSGSSCV